MFFKVAAVGKREGVRGSAAAALWCMSGRARECALPLHSAVIGYGCLAGCCF